MLLAEIIPPSVFRGISPDQNWLLFVIAAGAIAVLVYGADRAVSAAVRLAAELGISKVIIGATVVSLGTTMPEAAVSVNAAFQGDGGLALGNGVGSIIADTALIFGLGCLISRLPRDRFVLFRHGALKVMAGLLLTVTLFALALFKGGFDGVVIFRWIGVIYVILLAAYLYISVRWARRHPEIIPPEAEVEADQAAAHKAHLLRQGTVNFLILAFGLALIVFGSDVLVGSVKEISIRYHVPPDIIAVTFVALGTSLPELVTAITAVIKGHGEILVGNVIGADILNVLFVVGASASAVPLDVPVLFYSLHIPAMMASLLLMAAYIFLTRGKTFRRWQGAPLLALYAAYITLAVMLGAIN